MKKKSENSEQALIHLAVLTLQQASLGQRTEALMAYGAFPDANIVQAMDTCMVFLQEAGDADDRAVCRTLDHLAASLANRMTRQQLMDYNIQYLTIYSRDNPYRAVDDDRPNTTSATSPINTSIAPS